MRLLGYELSFARRNGALAVAVRKALPPSLREPPNAGWRKIWDSYVGQWQQDVEISTESVLTFSAVFACIRLISTDIGKLRPKLMRLEDDELDVWQEFTNTTHSPVLRKPNQYQNHIKFKEQWITQKLIHGRTPVLKERDARGAVRALRVCDPTLVQPLVSESGAVFFRVMTDRLSGLGEQEIVIPAREMIYDVHITPEHPLVGVSPIGACGLAATQGLKIQRNSAKFFGNMSRAGFVLSTDNAISDETATYLKEKWEAGFGGENYGRTAILGDGLKPQSFTINAEDSQLIEQLGWTAEDVCRAFGVPGYKINVGDMPAYNNIEALDMAYYSQCLQELIECMEALLDEGLELQSNYTVELDLDGLLRMDSKTRAEVDKTEMSAGILAPNEARAKRGLLPVEGGESPYLQQQNYSLAALAKRDAMEDPFATAKPAAPAPDAADQSGDGTSGQPDAADQPDATDAADQARALADFEENLMRTAEAA